VYAPQTQPIPAPVSVRLIGVLDADLIATFGALTAGALGASRATILVDVRDLDVLGETEMTALAAVVARARQGGRDVRLDARSLHWRRVSKKNISTQPGVDAQLRSAVCRTVIIAHSARSKRR
jgi:anti-anti-sigma regulatory factor